MDERTGVTVMPTVRGVPGSVALPGLWTLSPRFSVALTLPKWISSPMLPPFRPMSWIRKFLRTPFLPDVRMSEALFVGR
ncbi:hypothetical protein [Streptomyces sp. NPDC003077]|uniref:hypothetical protein n=1 Tax=Streptomyces sp. NPDC003077 TaxID=3154443 RepID=UPI0033B2B32B